MSTYIRHAHPLTSYITFDNSNIQKLQQVGLSDTITNDLKKITGRYKNENELLNIIDTLQSVQKIGGRTAFKNLLYSKEFFDNIYTFVTEDSTIIGFAAQGYLGQYINVFPNKKLVVVRTISSANTKLPTDRFFDFDILSYQLVK